VPGAYAPTLKVRILGKSENPTLPNNAAFFATGNNLVIVGDMTRRAIVGTLDPKTEQPELREFHTEDPIATAKRERPTYVCAALTILRAFHVAGRPEQKPPLGSFEDWSRWVRDALIWLGEPDPCATMERLRTDDPRLRELRAVLHHWSASIGTADVTVKQVLDKATAQYEGAFLQSDFREALLVVAGDRGAINSLRLGKWLGLSKGRVVNGMRIEQRSLLHGEGRWRVAPI
jgi:putative DNA primase/helicase